MPQMKLAIYYESKVRKKIYKVLNRVFTEWWKTPEFPSMFQSKIQERGLGLFRHPVKEKK